MSKVDGSDVLDALERLFHAVDGFDVPKAEDHAARAEAIEVLRANGRDPMDPRSLMALEERKYRAAPDPEPQVGSVVFVRVRQSFRVRHLDPDEMQVPEGELLEYDPNRPAIKLEGRWWGSNALDQALDKNWITLEGE